MRRLILLATLVLAACQGAADPKPEITILDRPRNVANRDDVIQNVVKMKIHGLDQTAFRAVTAEAWDGHVVLLGAVAKPEQKRRAEQAARTIQGVVDVTNDLTLAEATQLDRFLPDLGREYDLRALLGIDGRAGLTVRVINGVAYLIGAADPESASRLKDQAGDSEGIKWVVTHINPSIESDH
jgi:osmotically-inducible protein OsmY